MRRVLFWTVSAIALVGCSLFVSLDGLSGAASGNSGGTSDSGGSDASADSQAKDAGDGSTLLSYEDEVLSDSPVGYWRLGDTGSTAVDETTNKLDGTYGPAELTSAPGLISDPTDNATAFSGSQDGGGNVTGLTIPRSPVLEPTNAITVEGWFRPTGASPEGEVFSYGPQATAPFQPWDFQIGDHGSDYHVLFYTADVGSLYGDTAIAVGQTYYVAGTFDGTNLRLYINGQPDGTGGNSGSLGNYDATSGLGISSGFKGDYPFAGIIDEVAVYDHVLSPARIAAHYTAGTR